MFNVMYFANYYNIKKFSFSRKLSVRRSSRLAIPNDVRRRLSQLHTVSENSLDSRSGSQTSLNRSSNSDRRLSVKDNKNPLQKLHRTLSQGRILPYDSEEVSDEDSGKLIQDEKSEEGTVYKLFDNHSNVDFRGECP